MKTHFYGNNRRLSLCLALLIISVTAASCGKKSSSGSDKNKSEAVKTEREAEYKRSAEEKNLIESIANVIEKINSNAISKDIGLNQIAKLIGATNLQNTSDEDMAQIANIIASINGSSIQNLEILLGIEDTLTNDDFTPLAIDTIFMRLQNTGLDLPASMDKVLISYITLLKNKNNQNLSEKINDNYIYAYFKAKFDYMLINERENLESLFTNYAGLEDLLTPENLYKLFDGKVEEIKLHVKSSYASHRLYARLLSEKLQRNTFIAFNKNLLKSASENAKWSIERMTSDFSNIREASIIISDYFSLFDRIGEISPENKKVFINEVDYRSEVIAYSLEQKFKEMIDKGLDLTELYYIKSHPYFELYANKAILSDYRVYNSVDSFSKNLQENENDFIRKLNNYNRDLIQKDLEKNKYLLDYYFVELKRQFLEIKNLNKRIDKIEKKEVYDSLLESLLSALNYRNNSVEKLTLKNLRSSSQKIDLAQTLLLGNSSRLKDESTFLKNYCLDDNCPTTIFKAGIYVAPFEDLENKNIEIYTRELRFTPLALLYAPGGNVSINAQKIENIWIDASGLNGEQDGFLSHENKVTFPKGRCQTTHPDWGKDKKNESQKECKLVEELVPPQDQPQDGDLYLLKTSGKAAGKISINLSFDGVVVDVPLLVSRGGDGADGLKGLRAAPEGQECKDSFEIEEGIHKTWQQKYIREDRRGGRESDRSYFYTRWKSKQSGKIEKKTYSMKKSKGGRGGDAGDGRSVELKIATGEFNYLLNNIVNDEGVVGIGGEAGECGKGENKDYIGENGKEGKIL